MNRHEKYTDIVDETLPKGHLDRAIDGLIHRDKMYKALICKVSLYSVLCVCEKCIFLSKESLVSYRNCTFDLLFQKELPQQGWDNMTIEFALAELALLDSNNFVNPVGVGEREGRVYSGK